MRLLSSSPGTTRTSRSSTKPTSIRRKASRSRSKPSDETEKRLATLSSYLTALRDTGRPHRTDRNRPTGGSGARLSRPRLIFRRSEAPAEPKGIRLRKGQPSAKRVGAQPGRPYVLAGDQASCPEG